MKCTSLRFQNVYGPGQSLKNPYTGILSIFANKMRVNETINIYVVKPSIYLNQVSLKSFDIKSLNFLLRE